MRVFAKFEGQQSVARLRFGNTNCSPRRDASPRTSFDHLGPREGGLGPGGHPWGLHAPALRKPPRPHGVLGGPPSLGPVATACLAIFLGLHQSWQLSLPRGESYGRWRGVTPLAGALSTPLISHFIAFLS